MVPCRVVGSRNPPLLSLVDEEELEGVVVVIVDVALEPVVNNER